MVSENVRISFSKTGRLKYISHLDLCRTVYTAMIRAKIPLKYTEGFNPHPKMVFTQPLPLFAESKCELLDIRLTEPMPHEEICHRLRKQLTEELHINRVYEPSSKFSEIAYARYLLSGFENTEQSELDSLLGGEIRVLKRTKSGEEKESDIRPLVRSLEICSMDGGGEIGEAGGIIAVLSAASDAYLNPDVFCRALCARSLGDDYGIVRSGWYREDMSVFE